MYYEVHGTGEPVVLLHGAFMAITSNWPEMIARLSPTRQVIAVEMQGHGRTADIDRECTHDNLAADVAALLDHLRIPRADLIGYSLGGGVAMLAAIRYPGKVRKVVSLSAALRHDGVVKEATAAFATMNAAVFKNSPFEDEYRKLSPTPDAFPTFVDRVIRAIRTPYDFGNDRLQATAAPFFFVHGDADGTRLDHIAEMFRMKGGDTHGDLRPRSASRLAILPNTTHLSLLQKFDLIAPMIEEFLGADAEPVAKPNDRER
jgi:pimeloyl-ACP methyl ester carboxylesterase